MIERLLSVGTGALATFLMLIILNPTDSADPNADYLTAVVVGALVSLIWPLVWGFIAARRLKARRDEQIQKEVEKQMGGQG